MKRCCKNWNKDRLLTFSLLQKDEGKDDDGEGKKDEFSNDNSNFLNKNYENRFKWIIR